MINTENNIRNNGVLIALIRNNFKSKRQLFYFCLYNNFYNNLYNTYFIYYISENFPSSDKL